MDARRDGRSVTEPGPPAASPRKVLAGRLISLGLIPIAVFCAIFVLVRALVGTESAHAQAWTLSIALAAAVLSLFLLGSLTARAVMGEVQTIREALRAAAAGNPPAELPEFTPPLETLKSDVLALAQQSQEQQARLQERLDTARQQIFFLTNHDPLTGLPNRMSLEERLETALVTAKGQGSSHALLYLDIDYFHRINDAFGHLAGDDLLRRIAPVLQATLREGEFLARIGGDEFAVLLESCSAEYANSVATQLRDAVQLWQFEWADRAFQVGVSVGVVAITRLSPGMSAILSEADTACFTAKEQGRNRVFAFHESSTTQHVRQTSRGWI